MHVKFKNRQNQSVVMEVKLGVVFGDGVITGQGHEEPFGVLGNVLSDLGGAFGACPNAAEHRRFGRGVCVYMLAHGVMYLPCLYMYISMYIRRYARELGFVSLHFKHGKILGPSVQSPCLLSWSSLQGRPQKSF